MGSLTVYGGSVKATGGEYAAGIGSGDKAPDMAGYVTIYGGKVEAYGGKNSAGIGGGNKGTGAIVNIYGGTVEAEGDKYINFGTGSGGAGIGGGCNGAGNQCTIYGGTVTAKGGFHAAGIGGGYYGYSGEITIKGGVVTASSKIKYNDDEGAPYGGGGAGIGSGLKGNCGFITITGGTVTATSGGYYHLDSSPDNWWSGGAGIGGGYSAGGGTITISGGTVYANGYYGGAGIGAGDFCDSEVPASTITISGGTVYANAFSVCSGAAIGFGRGYKGAAIKVNISGGEVFAKAVGEDVNAIGRAHESNEFNADDLTIPDSYMVKAGADASSLSIFTADLRKSGCLYRKYAEIEPCTHSGATYTVSGTSTNDTHLKHCAHCTTAFEAETHTFENGKCTVCGVEGTTYTVTVYVPKADTQTDGDYDTSISYQMVKDETFNLPPAPNTPEGMEFVGWVTGENVDRTTFISDGSTSLLAAESPYTITADVTLTARYRYIDVILNDVYDNSEALIYYNGKKAHNVKLLGRTLYKDGNWNTLCLPFAVSSFTGTSLADATVKTLESSSFDSATGTLTLNFSDDLTAIEAGKPYIVKWESTESTEAKEDTEIVNPVFSGVTISNKTIYVSTTYVGFTGSFSPTVITGEDKTMLYLGADNTLYYPNDAMTIGACRAFFQLAEGLVCGEPQTAGAKGIGQFVLNFGDGETTRIVDVDLKSTSRESGISNPLQQTWFTLDGRKLSGKPTQKGVYINKGKKVVIK